MHIFYVVVSSITASFRIPEMHTFQKTLLLPPKTTLIGIMGAAMGFSMKDAQEYVLNNKILLSVIGTHRGMINDLWNYKKITSKNYTTEQIKKRENYSVVNREFLFDNKFVLFFGCENINILENIKMSIQDPVYALSAGNSDDIIKIHEISDIINRNLEKIDQFENTILPYNISNLFKLNIDLKTAPIATSIYVPQRFSLPTRFEFENGGRDGIDKKEFTFVTSKIKLDTPVDAYKIDDMMVVLY